MTLQSKHGTAQAISIKVGTLHKEFIDTIIKRSPFLDKQLVSLSLRRKHPLHLRRTSTYMNEYICNNSCMIKLLRMSEESRKALHLEISKDDLIAKKVIDLAEASKTPTDGTFYIQCLHTHKHKHMIITWTQSFLTTYANVYPNQEQPILPGLSTHNQDQNSAMATPYIDMEQTPILSRQ